MGHKFAEIAFTESVREVQRHLGSRDGYRAMDDGEDYNHVLGERESAFIAARDSFYMASVSETGWPYVQHRGGPAGFMRVLDPQTLGFADFSGNRQYVSVGNLRRDDRVSLFFMDYPNRTRLKVLGRVRLVTSEDQAMLERLEPEDYRARVERGFVIHIEAFDWNCPQHITPRYTEAEMMPPAAPAPPVHEHSPAATDSVLGDGPIALVISGVRQLTPRIRAYELRDPNGESLPPISAGSHLRVPVRLADGSLVERHYSICSNPARRDAWEIAVLRETDGNGGSLAVHDHFTLGTRLACEPPRNHFPLHGDARPAVLIAGGIGITPIKPMAQALEARGNTLHLHYAGREDAEMAFRDRLQREFGARLSLWRSADGERLDIDAALSGAPADAVFYVCGPARLIDAVTARADALGIAPERVRFERFSATVAADARPLRVELRRSARHVDVAADQSILDALLDAGVSAAFGCRTGTCRTCAVRVLDGEPEHHDTALSTTERTTNRLMCPCVSRASGEHLTLDL